VLMVFGCLVVSIVFLRRLGVGGWGRSGVVLMRRVVLGRSSCCCLIMRRMRRWFGGFWLSGRC